MCYSDDARPPLPPIGGAAADQGDIKLTSGDGTRIDAYYARAAEPTGAGMLILPDVRGLHHFYKELAERFAEAGIDAVAIDYFARTAPNDDRGEDFDWKAHTEQTTPEAIDADARAGIEWLRSKDGGAVRSVFSVGFCFGGSNSWRQAATQPELAGAVGFYGRPERVRDYLSRMKAPILILAAGADFTPVEEVEKFAGEVREHGTEVRMKVYDNAPHSYFDRTFAEHKDACDDSWRQILDFVNSHTTAPVG
jgi:carboxymethylenebutenolidase